MYGPAEDGSGLKLIQAPEDRAYAQPPKWPSGGGGLVGTASDYLRFAQMMLNGGELDGTRLLGRKTIELMTTNHLPPSLLLPMLTEELTVYGEGSVFGRLLKGPQGTEASGEKHPGFQNIAR